MKTPQANFWIFDIWCFQISKFFSETYYLVPLSHSLIVSNCLLIFSLCSFISNFKLSISSLLLLVSFGLFCFLFYLFHLDVCLCGGGVKFLLDWNWFLTLFSFSISLTDCFKLFTDFLTVFFHFKLQTLYLITVIAS